MRGGLDRACAGECPFRDNHDVEDAAPYKENRRVSFSHGSSQYRKSQKICKKALTGEESCDRLKRESLLFLKIELCTVQNKNFIKEMLV